MSILLMGAGADSFGATAPVTSYEGLVATRARFGSIQTGAGAGFYSNAMVRSAHVATDVISAIRLCFANFCLPTGVAYEQGNGGALTINTVAIEYPIGSTRQQMRFGGAANTTIPAISATSPGATAANGLAFTDYLTLATAIPKGATFRVWYYCSNANGQMPRSGTTSVWSTTLSDGLSGDAVLVGSSISDNTLSGSFSSNSASFAMPPVAIIGQTTQPSVIAFGDSITWGFYDTDTLDGRQGIVCRGLPSTMAFLNLGSCALRADQGPPAATVAALGMSGTTCYTLNRQQLFPYCSHAVIQLGINDSNSPQRSAAQILSCNQAVAALFPSQVKKFLTTLTPLCAVNDTKGYTDPSTMVGSQGSSYSAHMDYNESVRAVPSGFTGALDFYSVLAAGVPYLVTTGSIPNGSTQLTLAAGHGLTTADYGSAVKVPGAAFSVGPTITSIAGNVATLSQSNTGSAVTGGAVHVESNRWAVTYGSARQDTNFSFSTTANTTLTLTNAYSTDVGWSCRVPGAGSAASTIYSYITANTDATHDKMAGAGSTNVTAGTQTCSIGGASIEGTHPPPNGYVACASYLSPLVPTLFT